MPGPTRLGLYKAIGGEMNKASTWATIKSRVNDFFTKNYGSILLPWEVYQWKNSAQTFIEEGYSKNSTVYHAIDKIASKCGEIPLKLYRIQNGKKMEVENHALLDVLYNPNPVMNTYAQFVQAWVSYLKLTGNAYLYREVQAIELDDSQKEVFVVPSQYVQAYYDNLGRPEKYVIQKTKTDKETIIPSKDKKTALYATRLFNPNLNEGGQSPISPLRYAILLLNETAEYAVNFVRNRCTPPGVLSTEQQLTPEQRSQLEKHLRDRYAGSQSPNAGVPLVLWGGLTYQAMTGSGTEQVAVYEGQLDKERETARTLGVPPVLLGIPGDSTYNNILEAKKDFVLSTCVPLMNMLAASLSNWLLVGGSDEKLYLEPSIEELPEIVEYRAQSLKEINEIDYLSINEKRSLTGFDDMEENADADVYNDVFIDASKVLASDYDLFSGLDLEDEEDPDDDPDEDEEEIEEEDDEETDDDNDEDTDDEDEEDDESKSFNGGIVFRSKNA